MIIFPHFHRKFVSGNKRESKLESEEIEQGRARESKGEMLGESKSLMFSRYEAPVGGGGGVNKRERGGGIYKGDRAKTREVGGASAQ